MEDGTSESPGTPGDTVDAQVTGQVAQHDTALADEHDDEIWQWDTREGCEVRQILDRVADKWSLLAIALLDRRTMRFTELKREIDGISQRMLSRTLRQLERDGMVTRTVHPVVPPRVDYALTPMGATLHSTIKSLVVWTEDHQLEIARARAEYDARQPTTP
ncbi:winged helix-turn-helix transcriptional regulator [Oerskovia flava]|uniref:winged helix-turn-helix transcriptional regulator n=1 Tax=Oerskovia flava TaxID=2986422 RepID=UPI00223F907D|nr:helix-turn-helix domain-containing protein [Oerskovia sp. JB1-3-2]